MASTYGNDLRLEEIGDGEQSGTWGATTNTNLELIAEALSFGTEAITTNADTHTTTIADGATDPGRSLYLKYTGTLDSTCTITIAPNSISKTWYIENGTSGSQSIIISQGSGANVTIPTGQTKIVYSDGAGSGAAMAEIGTLGVTNLAVTTNATVGGTLGVTGVLTGTSLDISGNVDIDGTLETDALSINGTAVTSTAAELNILDGVTATTAELNIMDGVTATTAELNIMDGVTSTTAELNILDGVTSTATELNQLDAITRGSILYGNASGATARLAKGAADTVLTSDGTDLSWAAAGGAFMGSVVTVSSSGVTTLSAAQSGSLVYITNSAAILKLPTAAAGLFFGLRNTTDSDVIVRAASGTVYMNSRIMPSKIVEADGLGIIVGVDSTHWVADFDMPSAAIINRFHNSGNNSNYSETRTISAGTTSIGIFMQGGQAVVSYGQVSGSSVYFSAGCGGSSYSEKLITSSLPSSLTISGNYIVQDQSNVGNPNSASRLRVNGTGVDMYAGYPQGGLSYNPVSFNANGGVASGGDFNANGGQGRGSSGTYYSNANLVLSGGAGSGSPAGVGGRCYSGTSNSGTGKRYDGTTWVSSRNSSQNMRHGGGLGGNDGTATAGGAGGSKDSNAVAWTNYVGKEFYLPSGGTNVQPTSEGYDSGTYYGHYDFETGADGATFGITPSDLVLLFGPTSAPLFTREPKSYGANSFGTAGKGFQVGQAVIIEFKG
tara:strand:- start:3279 stop:5447 length:2169 start_codon:yes stop_codon:yes gene_type:complete